MRNPDDIGKEPLEDAGGGMLGATIGAAIIGALLGIVTGIDQGIPGGIVRGFMGAFMGGFVGGFLGGAIVGARGGGGGGASGIVGAISGAIVGCFMGGFFVPCLLFEVIGHVIGRIRALFWAIGVDVYPLGRKTPGELTPSGLLLLEMMPRSNNELHGVVRVRVDDPPSAGIERLLRTALMANEEAGALRLVMVGKKVVAFLAVGNAPRWPTGSLESELCKNGAVSDIIYHWVGTPSDDPKCRAMKRIMTSMVDRGLLEVDKRRVLKLFTMTSRYYVLPERISALDMQRSVDVHDQLTKDIAIGFDRQTIIVPSD